MSTAKKAGASLTKKEARKKVEIEMSKAFEYLKSFLDEKKFDHRVKKASKILMHGIKEKVSIEGKGSPEVKAAAPKKMKKVAAKKL